MVKANAGFKVEVMQVQFTNISLFDKTLHWGVCVSVGLLILLMSVIAC